ncbi:MAG: hypothetical protein AUG74_12325 [Bacteroidetes bacterium 13_1_20CM_4_60_6]|nr:MAG: hypothetical protein AUG74_12325 [Bacteroidetes bacterium 13_1_20CM_4_60_6]
MQYHFFEHVITGFRLHQLNDLHFIKLMQAVKPPNIFSITSRFATEAGSISSHFDWKFIFFYNDIPVNIGYRHFRRGN